MTFDAWSLDCPKCGHNHKLVPDSTGCAEIQGDCYQWCWYECPNCGWESESEEAINGDERIWEYLYVQFIQHMYSTVE